LIWNPLLLVSAIVMMSSQSVSRCCIITAPSKVCVSLCLQPALADLFARVGKGGGGGTATYRLGWAVITFPQGAPRAPAGLISNVQLWFDIVCVYTALHFAEFPWLRYWTYCRHGASAFYIARGIVICYFTLLSQDVAIPCEHPVLSVSWMYEGYNATSPPPHPRPNRHLYNKTVF